MWEDCSFVVSVTMGADGKAGVTIRSQTDSSDEYVVWLDPSASGTSTAVVLSLSDGITFISLGSASATIDSDTEYELTVKVVGDSISVYVDGTLVISTTDSALSSGTVGLHAVNASSAI